MGFLRAGVDKSALPSTNEAERWLGRFEKGYESGGSAESWQPPLRASCRSLVAQSRRVMMGICACNVEMGLAALKAWVSDLGLPKGKLFGMDVNGVPTPPKGLVFIKYNSDDGDAIISDYDGNYRGVILTTELTNGGFRQFGHLPLGLYEGY